MDLYECWSHLWSLTCRSWSSMTAPRVPTIGDRLPARIPWADLADSSQDCSRDDTKLPLAPLGDDKSYDTPAAGVNSKGGLNSLLSKTALKGPIDFSFLMNSQGQSAGGAAAPPTSSSLGQLNPSATSFVPMSSQRGLGAQPSSPSMPPPAVPPQAAGKSRRIRGKRALSALQAPPEKRPKEQAREAATPQQRASVPCEPPPPATEEEWQHRIGKRVKVVNSMRETPEYRAYIKKRSIADRLDGEPRTPTAEDRNLSKRRWEYEIQQWRTALKQWAKDNLPKEETDAMHVDEAALSPSAEPDDL